MKMKNLLFMIMALIAFSSCNNEVLYTGNGEEIQAEGYLTLSLTNPALTRTSGTVKDEGTTEENVISNLTVVFTDNNGIVKEVTQPVVSENKWEKFKVVLGEYDVYAIVNCPITVEKEEQIERVLTLAAEAEATNGFKNGTFMMVNKRNSVLEKAGVTVEITSANSWNSPATVSIQVDRVACKIVDETVKTGIDISKLLEESNDIFNDVEISGYALLNVNKKFNMIQTWGTTNPNGTTLEAGSDVLSTPLYEENGENLVADMYYRNISEYTTIEKIDGKITSITDKTKGVQGIFNKNVLYATENRPTIIDMGEKLTAGRGESTGVIYKVQAMDGENPAETFYAIKDKVYTTTDAVAAELGLENLEGYTIEKIRGLGVRVYEDGVMYYTHFIRDPNASHRYKDKNYLGVFRNSTYKLGITKFSALGDDVPGGGIVDPTQPGEQGNPPIESEEAYISVSVTINKWILNTIEIEF